MLFLVAAKILQKIETTKSFVKKTNIYLHIFLKLCKYRAF